MKADHEAWQEPWYGTGLYLASWIDNKNCKAADYRRWRQIADGKPKFIQMSLGHSYKDERGAHWYEDASSEQSAKYYRVMSIFCEEGQKEIENACDSYASPEYGLRRLPAIKLHEIDYSWAEPFCALAALGEGFPVLKGNRGEGKNVKGLTESKDSIIWAQYGRTLLRRYTVNPPSKNFMQILFPSNDQTTNKDYVFYVLKKGATLGHLSAQTDYCSWSLISDDHYEEGYSYCRQAWAKAKVPSAAYNAAIYLGYGRVGKDMDYYDRLRLAITYAEASNRSGLTFDDNVLSDWRQRIADEETRNSAKNNGPSSTYHASEASSNNGNGWKVVLALGLLVVFGAAVTNDGNKRTATTYSQSGDTWQPENSTDYEAQQKRNAYRPPEYSEPKPDTSVGCLWGDSAYGTCH